MGDHFRANFGLWVLVLIFLLMVALVLVIYFIPRPGGADLLTWLQGKAGEVLAAIMTMIVGAVAATRRKGENGNNNGTPIPPIEGAAHP